MPVSCRSMVVLGDGQRRLLVARARRVSGEHRGVLRARIVVAAADGAPSAVIARDLGVTEDTVRTWRRRFCERGLEGLADRPRSGRPRRFPAQVVAEVKALARELPRRQWCSVGHMELPGPGRRGGAARHPRLGVGVHGAPLAAHRCHQAPATPLVDLPRDPDFARKATRVLDLYARLWQGEPLGGDDYVISADEKPGVQARSRIHPGRHPGPGRRPMRVESEYRRHGTLAYLAAHDVHRAHVIGHCAPTTGIEPFTALAAKVMTTEPYACARRVFWVLDNGASRRGWTAAARLNDTWSNATMIHLPVQASWLNQVEIYFSAVQRKLLTPDDFPNLDVLAERLTAFENRYNHAARPFDWRFNRDDLNRLLTRIAA
jgi:transposase-like protein